MLTKSPVILGLSLYIAMILGYAYLLFVTFSVVFQLKYGFSQGNAGLSYLGIGTGMMLALAWMSRYSDRIFTNKEKQTGATKAEYLISIICIFVPI